MKIYFLLFILLIPLTSAIQFSPTVLEFNLEKNQISCKNINFQIESQTLVHDSWAQSSSESWSISNFQTSSQELGLETDFPTEINSGENKIQFCISGSTPGDYHGALIFREGEIGNSVVQFAVWLKVKINPSDEPNHPDNDGKSSSKRSNSQSSSGQTWTSTQAPKENFQEVNYNQPKEEIKLSSSKVQEKNNVQIFLIALPIALLIVLIFFFIRRHY